MDRTRKDAETGSEVELALAPKGSTQSEEEKYQPTPKQQGRSEAEDSHQRSPRKKRKRRREKNNKKMK